VQVLRTVIGSADSKGDAVFLHFNKPTPNSIKQGVRNLDLNKLMQNVGAEQFDFETFKSAYDTDPRVKTMIKNFDKDGIEPKTQKEREEGVASSGPDGADTVSQMAQRATDLGDKI